MRWDRHHTSRFSSDNVQKTGTDPATPTPKTARIASADAVADVAATAGENVTTAIRADLKEFKAETDTRFAEVNARFTEVRADIKELAGSIQSLHRDVATLRWMIGIGFTLLSIFLALSTFLRA